MFDQVAPSALGCYGNPVVKAPTIDRLAREGVVFDAAYSNSPLCTPARYCMMTGQLPSATRGYDNAAYLASTIPTFAHYLRSAGYRTVLDGKMHFVGAGPAARLRGASYDGHLPGRLRLDPRLAAARRAGRLVVPQHGCGHPGGRRRGHQPAALRRRGRPHGRARAARAGPRRGRATLDAGRLLHPPARPLRHAAPVLGRLRGGRHPDAPARRGRRAAGSAHGAAAPGQRDGPGRDHRPRRTPGPPRLLRQHLLPRRVDRTPDLDPDRSRRGRRHRGRACWPTTETCSASAGSGTR